MKFKHQIITKRYGLLFFMGGDIIFSLGGTSYYTEFTPGVYDPGVIRIWGKGSRPVYSSAPFKTSEVTLETLISIVYKFILSVECGDIKIKRRR